MRKLSATLLAVFLTTLLPAAPAFAATPRFMEKIFESPIDAFSAKLPEDSLSFKYSTLVGKRWSVWEEYENDGDRSFGEESELLMVPVGTVGLRVTDMKSINDIHEIVVSKDPIKTKVTVTSGGGTSKVVSRSEWGADESFLYEVPGVDDDGGTSAGDNGAGETSVQLSQRVKDCQSAQSLYPQEFKVDRTVTKDSAGNKYAWPLQYSKSVKMIVVHHSALLLRGDPRSSVERLRALYKYHAVSNGWGDIGYNYVIDEKGKIYEGRQGGKDVVGGHAYCNNVGTMGIVLMGNFELEQPTQEQAKSLQWLIKKLSTDYNIDLTKSVQFHGKKFLTPVVGHKDLLSTLCPGYYLFNALSQIRANVLENKLDGAVVFPAMPSSSAASSSRSSSRAGGTVQNPQFPKVAEGISFVGRTSITINPGGQQRLSFSYTASDAGAYEGKKVADIKLSSKDIKLWLDNGRSKNPVSTGILLPYDLPAGESLTFQLILQAPVNNGTYVMDIAGIRFTLSVFGRRARTGEYVNPFTGNPMLTVEPPAPVRSNTVESRVRPQTRRSLSSSASSSRASSRASSASSLSSSSPSTIWSDSDQAPIRILLSADPGVAVSFADTGLVADKTVQGGNSYTLVLKNGECEVQNRGAKFLSSGLVRLRSTKSGILTVSSVKGYTRQYRGTLECRVVDGKLALINELPLEDYMRGLAEEPDSEPYEKQRAFAIAARTYAAYYMQQDGLRKFPGKPYDGSDDPAVFQSYAGVGFEGNNPEWVRAVNSTNNQVLLYKNALLRVPYFSSDDGRTRAPSEAGWNNFPNAEVFTSKADPWCKGLTLRGHGVGMSGCGALGQAKEGRSGEQILQYYYPGARIVEAQ